VQAPAEAGLEAALAQVVALGVVLAELEVVPVRAQESVVAPSVMAARPLENG